MFRERERYVETREVDGEREIHREKFKTVGKKRIKIN